ncbi:MAG: BACON domain-containing carbohydrate-binding protein, partial [Chloracidobacterium sp.]
MGLVAGEPALAQAPGTLDAAFAPVILDPSNNPGVVYAVAVQSDGRIVIGGEFTSVNGSGRSRIARLNADGSLDTSFNPGSGAGGSLFPSVFAVAIQSDGRIVIGGDFSTFNGIGRNNIARLNADGSLDESFNPGTGIGGGIFPAVYALAVQADGRILVGGEFTSVNGVGRNNIARLNANGALDTTFDPGSGIGGLSPSVQEIAVQADGRVVVGGQFSNVNGVGRNNMARLNSNGSLDTAFNPGSGTDDTVQTVVIQSDGKLLIAGFFTSVNGIPRGRVARLNPDGTVDSGFASGSGANEVVSAMALQPDGRVVIGGDFTSVGGSSRNRIARLSASGGLDPTFDPGSGITGGVVWSVAVQANGRVLVGGGFTTVNGTPRASLARLFGGDSGGGGGCTFNITPNGATVPAGSVTGNVTVIAGAGCAWTATSNVPWATITSGASGSGNGTVGYTVAANTSVPRTGTLTIAGQTFTINQAGGCTYAITPQGTTVTADGGSGTVAVTTNDGCPWTATSNVPWVTITSGASGSGNGTVNYTVAANTGAARSGALTIAGREFTVNQGAVGCAYNITPTTANVVASGGSGTVNVTTAAGCPWTAT